MHTTVVMLGVIGAVILVAALTSGVLERTRFPQVLLFLALGTAAGPLGLGLFDLGIESETVRIVSVLGLVLVLFTDAVSVTFAELKSHLRLAAVILGPGTALTALVTGFSAHLLLGLGGAESAILGAALASTDPVLLRGILRGPTTPESARQALRIESGMNDAVLLPVVLVASALLAPAGSEAAGGWAEIVLGVLLLGGGAGVTVGFLAVGALDLVRPRFGVRRDYESLYVLAVALTAFAAAEAVHGSGFIAAFAAGLTVAALDVDLCDCFYDYGEASAEMALLFTFVILGSSALWSGLAAVDARTLLFAAVALFARGAILAVALAPTRLDRASRRIVVWFGPRGLSSLLLVLLPVFAGVPGSEALFQVTALVVLLSIVIHGGSQALLRIEPPAPGPVPPPPAPASGVADDVRIHLDELAGVEARGEPVVLVDVRSEASWRDDPRDAAGAVRVAPDRPVEGVRTLGLPPDTWLVLFCT